MGSNEEEVGTMELPHQPMKRQGGFTATYFIYVMMFLDNIGFVANMVSFVLYFMFIMKFDVSSSATTTTDYLGTTFLLTIVGGFISDVYMTRLNTALVFGAIELMGYLLLIIQAHYPKLQPSPCGESTCVHGSRAILFYISIGLVGLGGGGIRGSIPALGADQFDHNNPKQSKDIATFFNWLLLSITLGAILGVTFVVYLGTEVRWDIGFAVSLCCAFFGLLFLAAGKPFYRGRVPGESPLLRALEVLVVAVKNLRTEVPSNPDELYEIRSGKSIWRGELIPHTTQFRLLNKAAVLPRGIAPRKWKVCTVTQVEEVKILARMMPILLSTILMNTCLAQLQTFSVQQGTLMNTRLGDSNFHVPAASIPVIPLVFMSILIPIYEFTFVPVIRRLTGHPNGITHLQRVGVGLVLSAISMAIAGLVEVKRKHELLHHGHRISLFWLSFHYAIFGVADMFTLVGLMEFFYSEAPQGMRSLSTSFSWLSLAIGYYLNSAFIDVINLVSAKLSKNNRGWLQGRDMNAVRLERFYWFLAVLSVVNFVIYLCSAHWYKYKNDDSFSTSTVATSFVSRSQDFSTVRQEKEEQRMGSEAP